MGRQNGDAKVANSSIALLQERFRKLQKIREKRQEKQQLLKLLESESESTSSTSSSSSLVPGPIHNIQHPVPSADRQQESLLSLTLNSQTSYNEAASSIINNNVPPSDLWSNSGTFDNSDVDTSLHL